MRFKTFGDLDAPEWILAQIVTMFANFAFVLRLYSLTQRYVCRAKLSSIRFKMLCTQVIACMVDGTSIDHEKIMKMTKDASFDNSDTKAVLAAINHMFRSAARFDCDDEVFSNEIGQLGLPKEHVDAMVRCFKEKKIALRCALREDMISAPLLNSFDWRASVVLGSSEPCVHKKSVMPLIFEPILHTYRSLASQRFLNIFQKFLYCLQAGMAHLHMVLHDGGQDRTLSFAAGANTFSLCISTPTLNQHLKHISPHLQAQKRSTRS